MKSTAQPVRHESTEYYLKTNQIIVECVWVHGCDPGRVSDGSRLALYQTLAIECPSIFFGHVICVIIVPLFLSFFCFCFLLLFCFHALVGAL